MLTVANYQEAPEGPAVSDGPGTNSEYLKAMIESAEYATVE